MRLSCFFWATGCVQTDSASSQIRRNRRQESPLVVLRRIRDLRRARGESRGGRRRDMGAAFFCVMKSSCSRGVEGRHPGLGFNRLPCGNCLWGWYLGPAARGGVSSGRSFHTEGTWCFAGAVKFMSIFQCFIFPYFSSEKPIFFFQI